MAVFHTVLRARETVTDANGEPRVTHRDAPDRIVAIQERNKIGAATQPTPVVTAYDYDVLDRLTRVTDAGGNPTSPSWDSLGRMITLNSLDSGTTLYDYDLGGNLRRKQNANGKLIQYRYTRNRLDRIDYPDAGSVPVVFTYGPPDPAMSPIRGKGRVTTRTDETGRTDYEYGDFGEVTKTTWAATPPSGQPAQPAYVTTYQYDHIFNTLQNMTIEAG